MIVGLNVRTVRQRRQWTVYVTPPGEEESVLGVFASAGQARQAAAAWSADLADRLAGEGPQPCNVCGTDEGELVEAGGLWWCRPCADWQTGRQLDGDDG